MEQKSKHQDHHRVIILRGHQATPWEMSPWQHLGRDFEATLLLTRRNAWDISPVHLSVKPVRTLGSLLPKNSLSSFLITLLNDRYLDLKRHLDHADIVHAEELSFWFAAQAARLKKRHNMRYKLVQTVWETIPLLKTYRHHHGKLYRSQVLQGTDLFLAATERARQSLLLEGVDAARIKVCHPGIDTERFSKAAEAVGDRSAHTIISPGRLVWEKGHQDVLRAIAALHQGIVRLPSGEISTPGLHIVGDGPEQERLQRHATELGLEHVTRFSSVSYDAMPLLFAEATCMVLASLPAALKPYHLLDRPRIFWEEQFGMVIPEALASGLPVIASRCGAIPEVLGSEGVYFSPGDWFGLAKCLAEGPLSRAPNSRSVSDPRMIEYYSDREAGRRLTDAYRGLLNSSESENT